MCSSLVTGPKEGEKQSTVYISRIIYNSLLLIIFEKWPSTQEIISYVVSTAPAVESLWKGRKRNRLLWSSESPEHLSPVYNATLRFGMWSPVCEKKTTPTHSRQIVLGNEWMERMEIIFSLSLKKYISYFYNEWALFMSIKHNADIYRRGNNVCMASVHK